MKMFAKSAIAVSMVLAGTPAVAGTSVTFPTSVDDASAFSVPGTTHADRHAGEVVRDHERASETAPARGKVRAFGQALRNARPQDPAGVAQAADG